MATVINEAPKRGNQFASALGEGLSNLVSSGSQAYMQQADQMAIQKAIEGLGPNAGARDILNAVTGARTYSPQAKQQAFENYLGAEKIESAKQAAELERLKEASEKAVEQNSAVELVKSSTLPLGTQKELTEKLLKGELSYKTIKDIINNPERIKRDEKIGVANLALSSIDQMQALRDQGNLGRTITAPLGPTYSPYAEVREQAGEYEQLGKSLIQQATDIQVRNMAEFKTFADKLIHSSLNDAEAKGILKGLRRRIEERKKELENPNYKEKETSNGLDETEELPDLPDPKTFANKTIKSPEGQKYYSDGTRWIKK